MGSWFPLILRPPCEWSLRSTAGCGKPHVRWCGRVSGRNPADPTRSSTRSVDRKPRPPILDAHRDHEPKRRNSCNICYKNCAKRLPRGYPESRSKSLSTNTRYSHAKRWPEGLGDSWVAATTPSRCHGHHSPRLGTDVLLDARRQAAPRQGLNAAWPVRRS
jgi:hypothetical protein